MKKLLLILSALFITACTNNKDDVSYVLYEEHIEMNENQKVILTLTRGIDDHKQIGEKFRVIKPSHTAKVTTLKILSIVPSILTGQSVTGFTKSELVGDVIQIEDIYKNYLFGKMKDNIKSNVKLDKETTKQIVKIIPEQFALIYDELVGNNNYTLYLDFLVSFPYKNKAENGDVIAGSKKFKCNEKLEGKVLEEWEKNGYQEVLVSAKKMMDKCVNDFNTELSEIK